MPSQRDPPPEYWGSPPNARRQGRPTRDQPDGLDARNKGWPTVAGRRYAVVGNHSVSLPRFSYLASVGQPIAGGRSLKPPKTLNLVIQGPVIWPSRTGSCTSSI